MIDEHKLIKLLIAMSEKDILVWKHKTKKGKRAWNAYAGYSGQTVDTFIHTYSVKYDGAMGGNAFTASVEFDYLASRERDPGTVSDYREYHDVSRVSYTQEGHQMDVLINPRAKDNDVSWKLHHQLHKALAENMDRQAEVLVGVSIDSMLEQFQS